MTDRELLELAANAAGMTIHSANQAQRDACGDGDVGLWISNDTTCWNPLTDDGDALRLAVRMGIDLEIQGELYGLTSNDHTIATNQNSDEYWEPSNPDPYAATRRAIVRAAAEIGRQMK